MILLISECDSDSIEKQIDGHYGQEFALSQDEYDECEEAWLGRRYAEVSEQFKR